MTNENKVNLESAKKVITKDLSGKENGFLVELTKSGKLTTSYLSCCYPGAFKGYHLHKVRTAHYVCVRGTIKIILYTAEGRQEHVLSADNPVRLVIPTFVPTGLLNEGNEEAWIINNPDPAYDPDLLGEQIDYTQEQLDCLFSHKESAPNLLKKARSVIEQLLKPQYPVYDFGPTIIGNPLEISSESTVFQWTSGIGQSKFDGYK